MFVGFFIYIHFCLFFFCSRQLIKEDFLAGLDEEEDEAQFLKEHEAFIDPSFTGGKKKQTNMNCLC